MPEKNWLQRLTKSQTDKWIGGVCGGLGENTPIPSWCWRLLFCVLFFFFGFGLLFYILLWIFVPAGEKKENE
jgi:phage shock protein C